MSQATPQSHPDGGTASIDARRLGREQRREALLDVATAMVRAGDLDAVTIESVAERAGVSRALLYKHFADRHDLLAAVYRRESDGVHAELTAAVQAADGLEHMFRALIKGALASQARRGAEFTALRAAGLRTRERRDEQRRRDRITLRTFAGQAEREFGIDAQSARAGVGILLGAIDAVLAQWRVRPTAERAALLERTYVTLVVGGLQALSSRTAPDGRPTSA